MKILFDGTGTADCNWSADPAEQKKNARRENVLPAYYGEAVIL